MPRKTPAPLTIAPLQHIIVEEITDPAEQAALDKLHSREKRKQRAAQGKTHHDGVNAAKNSTPRIAPLQHIIAEPITDPAEQAALDRLHKREKRKQREAQGKAHHRGVNAAKASAPRRR
jgi:hypothetical protein